jgi:hypothetical protein
MTKRPAWLMKVHQCYFPYPLPTMRLDLLFGQLPSVAASEVTEVETRTWYSNN